MEEVLAYFRLSQKTGFYSNGGPCVQLLAHRLSEHLDGAHCLPVASATHGLLVTLRALFGAPTSGRGYVVTPSFTFTATACAIRWAGFTPLFVDIEPDSWQMSPPALAEALRAHAGAVAGVVGCSTFGTLAPLAVRRAWGSLCSEHDVPLMLDSAAALDAVGPGGERAGTLAETEVFSFHATKPFAVGEGGLVTTRDAELAARMERLANFGICPSTQASEDVGLNAKLSEIHAATALAMLDRYEDVLRRRRANASGLRARLAGQPLLYQRGAEGSTWQFFQVLLAEPEQRSAALRHAGELGVQVRTCFDPPLHRHPAFADAGIGGVLPVTEDVAARALSLPLANTLSESQLCRIAGVVERACA